MIAKRRKANKVKKLASQLEQDFKTTLSLSENVNEFYDSVLPKDVGKDANIYAVALSLQHYYTSLETAFKRIAKELEGDLPDGGQWHLELLEQMAIEIKGVRPALIDNDIKKKLDKLRRFRHVVRHGYEYELDWQQIKPLVDEMNNINNSLEKDFADFEEFLLELAEEVE